MINDQWNAAGRGCGEQNNERANDCAEVPRDIERRKCPVAKSGAATKLAATADAAFKVLSDLPTFFDVSAKSTRGRERYRTRANYRITVGSCGNAHAL